MLIALAVLIGLGFGIFQISKSVANDGVGDVQQELDSVSTSQFTTYDQTIITGTMASSAISDFEGESVAVLIANQAWKNVLANADAAVGDYESILDAGSGLSNVYAEADADVGVMLPVVWAYTDSEFNTAYKMLSNAGDELEGAFINYNALVGGAGTGSGDSSTNPLGTTQQTCSINGSDVFMAGIYFDNNCWRCTSGFAADASGKVLFNGITGNLSKTGRTEYIPSGAKFDSYLLKDASGSYMGVVLEQINNG